MALLKFIVVCVTGCLFLYESGATVISGKVTGFNNEPLAFANVYVKGTSKGTTTNIEGNYKLELPEGNVELVFRYLGYKMRIETIVVSGVQMQLNVQLVSENYTLNEVQIRAGDEDPAYAIIRNAIDKRKFYLNQVDEFSCDVYVKGLQKITKHPDKIFGVEVDLSQFVDSTTGIAYLSESVSKYHFKKPDQVKEVMISSKVSGSNRAFSFNQASDMEFNFYENIMMAEGLSPRGFISPIASSALFYYRYKLEGSFYENGHWVNKIAVLPKRKNDPVYSGYIFIQDSTWRIHSTDLFLTKDAQIQFVDTLRINQVFIPAGHDESIWLQGSVTFRFVFSFMGFEGDGNFVGIFSGYEVNPGFKKGHFKGSVMKINDDSNKRDTSYWEMMRPIPLTPEESVDYMKRDSVREIKESKPYLDSLDRKSNKFKPGNLLSGYTYYDRYSKTEISFSSMLENIQFNTVEGLVVGVSGRLEKKFEMLKSLETDLSFRYGFSNYKWSSTGKIKYHYHLKKFAYISVEGGDDLVQFNEMKPIGAAINSYYTLFREKNYMKLFHKQFGRVESRYEIINGVRLEGGFEFARRSAVKNTTDFTFVDNKNREYTSNTPQSPEFNFPFQTNEAFKINISARIRPKQKYIDRPDINIILGSKWPTFIINYEKGIKSIAGSDVDYDRAEAGIEDKFSLGMLGKFNYSLWYGRFLNTNELYFMDHAHVLANQTIFSGFETRRYDLLEYYTYSTTREYIQAFAAQEFGGFILNKIPLLKKLKLNEIAGFRYLHVPGKKDHFEVSFGLEKLGILRADYVIAFDESGNSQSGIVIGVRGVIGR